MSDSLKWFRSSFQLRGAVDQPRGVRRGGRYCLL